MHIQFQIKKIDWVDWVDWDGRAITYKQLFTITSFKIAMSFLGHHFQEENAHSYPNKNT